MENEDEQQENCQIFRVINPRQINRNILPVLDNSTNTEQTTKSCEFLYLFLCLSIFKGISLNFHLILYKPVKPFNPEKFRCKNGMHVLKRWICDFQQDCSDGSDEDPEMCGRQ